MAKTCGNCVHAKICKKVVGYWFSPKNIAYCEAYKDSTNYVEVVRCKDCEHWLERYAYGMWTYHQCWITGHIPNKDHFCSYGERREGE